MTHIRHLLCAATIIITALSATALPVIAAAEILRTSAGDFPRKIVIYYLNGKPVAQEVYDLGSGKAALTGTVPDGTVTERYDDKSPRYIQRYRGGKMHGLSREFFPDGTIKEERLYRHGERHGITRKFDERGALASVAMYKNGMLWGPIILKNSLQAQVPRRTMLILHGILAGWYMCVFATVFITLKINAGTTRWITLACLTGPLALLLLALVPRGNRRDPLRYPYVHILATPATPHRYRPAGISAVGMLEIAAAAGAMVAVSLLVHLVVIYGPEELGLAVISLALCALGAAVFAYGFLIMGALVLRLKEAGRALSIIAAIALTAAVVTATMIPVMHTVTFMAYLVYFANIPRLLLDYAPLFLLLPCILCVMYCSRPSIKKYFN